MYCRLNKFFPVTGVYFIRVSRIGKKFTGSDIKIVNSEQMLEFMETGKVLLIDARKTSDFEHSTIPGSTHCRIISGKPSFDEEQVLLSIKDFKSCKNITNTDRSTSIAVFCNGKNCWRSGKGALALKRMGFDKVYWYRIGMNDWKNQGLPME